MRTKSHQYRSYQEGCGPGSVSGNGKERKWKLYTFYANTCIKGDYHNINEFKGSTRITQERTRTNTRIKQEIALHMSKTIPQAPAEPKYERTLHAHLASQTTGV